MRRHNKTRIQFVRDVVAGVVALLIGICVLLFTESKLWAFALIVPSLVLLLMIGYVKFVVPIKIYQAAKRKLSSEYMIQFRDDGMRFRYSDIDSSLKWSVFSTWLRDNEFYILYHGTRDVSVVPRRSFANGDDDRLMDMLVRKIGPSLSD